MFRKKKENKQRGIAFIPFLVGAAILAGLSSFGWLTGMHLAERFAWTLLILIFNVLATITVSFAWLAGHILQWAISPSFTTLSYTSPAGNPVIDVGLSVTQGFANMILVLVLVFIALAVILRVAGYEIKKLLPTFVLVALLVNFAPVLVGLIVDASNIVMNYFTSGLTQFTAWVDQMGSVWSGVLTVAGFGSIEAARSALFYSAAVAIFSFFIGIAFLTYALIFIVRYVVIWVLTILAPLAFVLYILPATRGLTRKWWEQLVQWSFIGVTAGFFLYLSSFVIAGARDWFRAPPAEGLNPGVVGTILVYMVPLVFLYLGLTIGMATSAMGATAVIRGSLRAQRWGAREGLVGARAGLRRLISSERAESWGLKETLERQAAARFMPQRIAQIQNRALRWTATALTSPATGVSWVVRRGIGEAALRMKEADEADMAKAEGEYKGANVERKLAAMRDVRLGWANRAGALRATIEDEEIGDLRRIMQAEGLNDQQIEQEIINIGRAALRVHPDMFKKIRDAFPHLARRMGEGFSEGVRRASGLEFADPAEAESFNHQIEARIMAKMRTDRIPKMDWESAFNFTNEEGVHIIENAFHHFAAPEQLKAALRSHGRGFAIRFQGRARRLGSGWYAVNNAPLGRYLNSTPAQDLGVGFVEGEGEPELFDAFGRPIR